MPESRDIRDVIRDVIAHYEGSAVAGDAHVPDPDDRSGPRSAVGDVHRALSGAIDLVRSARTLLRGREHGRITLSRKLIRAAIADLEAAAGACTPD